MIADYADGMGCVLLSRNYGIAENTVIARMRDAGVEIRHHQVVDADVIHSMARERAQGLTLAAIGSSHGLTRQTVAKQSPFHAAGEGRWPPS
jgi:hypothetical protein